MLIGDTLNIFNSEKGKVLTAILINYRNPTVVYYLCRDVALHLNIVNKANFHNIVFGRIVLLEKIASPHKCAYKMVPADTLQEIIADYESEGV